MPRKKPERNKKQASEEKSAELTSTKYLIETIKQLQSQNENLKAELVRSKRFLPSMIGISLILPGVLALAFSIDVNSPTLAFIGLGLTFWGALFFFVRPIKYVRSSLLDSTAISSYSTIDRIVKDLKYEGKGFYVPPYPKDVYLPDYLKGLKDMIVFISAKGPTEMPSIEEMAKGRFFLENAKGISVAPPGLGLLSQFEVELRSEFSTLDLEELCETLPRLVTENFQIAKKVEMKHEKGQISLKIIDSTYKNLYVKENLQSIHFLGCPLVSAIAGAVAKSTGKVVTIRKDKISPDAEIVEVWLRIIEGNV